MKPKSDCQITVTTTPVEITSSGRLFPKLSLKDSLGLDIPALDMDPSTTEIIVTNNTEDFIELTMSAALGIFQSFNNIPFDTCYIHSINSPLLDHFSSTLFFPTSTSIKY